MRPLVGLAFVGLSLAIAGWLNVAGANGNPLVWLLAVGGTLICVLSLVLALVVGLHERRTPRDL